MKLTTMISRKLHLRNKDIKQYFKFNMLLLIIIFINLMTSMAACSFTQNFSDARLFAWTGLLVCVASILICFIYSKKAKLSNEFSSFLGGIYLHSLHIIAILYILILLSSYLKWGDFYTAGILFLLIYFMVLASFCVIPTPLFKDYFVPIVTCLIILASIMNKIPRITSALTYTGIILPIVLVYSDKSNWELMGVCPNYIHLSNTIKQKCILFLLNIGSIALSVVLLIVPKVEAPLSLEKTINTISPVRNPITCVILNGVQGIIYLLNLLGYFVMTFGFLLLLGYIVGNFINFTSNIKTNKE